MAKADTATHFEDKEGNEVELKELLKGKTKEQIQATKFFHGIPISEGCFRKEYMTEGGYSDIVKSCLTGDSKQKAMNSLGIDEDQVKEIDPVSFQGYRYFHDKLSPYVTFMGSTYFSSMYEVTWIFFGEEQIFVYNHGFDTTDETVTDSTQEYFYSDVTSFAAKSDTVPKKVWVTKKEGCSTSRESEKKMIKSSLFRIIVPGAVFETACGADPSVEAKISAMKQKLREKKRQ